MLYICRLFCSSSSSRESFYSSWKTFTTSTTLPYRCLGLLYTLFSIVVLWSHRILNPCGFCQFNAVYGVPQIILLILTRRFVITSCRHKMQQPHSLDFDSKIRMWRCQQQRPRWLFLNRTVDKETSGRKMFPGLRPRDKRVCSGIPSRFCRTSRHTTDCSIRPTALLYLPVYLSVGTGRQSSLARVAQFR